VQKFIAIDTETTGIMVGSRLIEIAAVLFNTDGVIETFERLVNPGMPIPPDATSVNAITNDMVKDAPSADIVLNEFFDWLDNHSLMAHYAMFDTGVISWEAGRFGIQIPEGITVIDTCDIAKSLGVTKNNKLTTLAEHYRLHSNGDAHRALADADLCAQYYLEAIKHGGIGNPIPWHEVGHNYKYTDRFPDHLKNFPELVRTATPISFKYVDSKGAETERTLIPNGWAEQNDNLMINGWCQLRAATRTFRADRIVELTTAATRTASTEPAEGTKS